MSLQISRRSLFGTAAAFAAGFQKAQGAELASSDESVRLGVASYSLREYSRGLAIKCIKELNTPYVNIKEFHLPVNSTPDEIEKGRKDFEKAGLKIVGGGNMSIQKDDPADIRRFFEYAKMAGMPLMVIAPTHQNIPKIESFVKEYNIKV